MALDIAARYGLQAQPASPQYPQGAGKNDAVPGDQTGTPFDKDFFNDIIGFLQGLIVDAGITISGNPDTADNSDYKNALEAIIVAKINDAITNGDLDARINQKISERLQVVGGILKYDANNNGDLDT